ncbi:MAG: amidohydrolase family protein [Pseudomonadota bacterium]
MYDIVIRNGTILDGTGTEAYLGDVAVANGKIVGIGASVDGRGHREIDAQGQLVIPGWVDAHTHYDGQATWDAEMTPSAWHGVTTIVMGNCGVGFAPAKAEQHGWLIELMEGVEDIPGAALAEGLEYNWESFPEYLDALESQSRTIDVAAQMPHHALRVYVMGERAVNNEDATADDIATMARLTGEAINAGALGFTTSRTYVHRTSKGDHVPGMYAAPDELVGIAKGMGGGAFGMISDFVDEDADMAWMRRVVAESGRPLWFLLTRWDHEGDKWKRMLDRTAAAAADGLDIRAQVANRPIGALMSLAGSLHPFIGHREYKAIAHLPVAERAAKMREKAVRLAILSEERNVKSPFMKTVTQDFHKLFPLVEPLDFEPTADKSVQAIAEREGRTPAEVAYDLLSAGDGGQTFFFPLVNYGEGDLEVVRAMMTHPQTLLGLGDGGAHCGVICDASMPTTLLSHWARDRQRGDKLPLEWLVKRQTADNADYFAMHDRGRLKAGLRADINIIDFDQLNVGLPHIVHDLPAGGRRFVQRAKGYTATLVNGEVIVENDELTGRRPGRLFRGGR